MDELRNEIWDYLSRSGGRRSLYELSQHFRRDRAVVRAVVNHRWFEVSGENVAIAYTSPLRRQDRSSAQNG